MTAPFEPNVLGDRLHATCVVDSGQQEDRTNRRWVEHDGSRLKRRCVRSRRAQDGDLDESVSGEERIFTPHI
jgi:hypothetical protein